MLKFPRVTGLARCVCTRILAERNFRPEDFVELIPVGQEISNKIFSSPPEINPSRATDETAVRGTLLVVQTIPRHQQNNWDNDLRDFDI